MHRRDVLNMPALLLVLAFHLTMMASASAAETVPFSASAFETAKTAGRPILIDVSAPWCPTCSAQRPILAKLEAEPKFKALVVFLVDFDTQKDVLRSLDVRMQSTLICFKNGRETARSTGETKPAALAQLLDQTL